MRPRPFLEGHFFENQQRATVVGEVVQSVVTQAGDGGGMSFILMMAAMFAILYFMLIRPQRKQQAQHQELLAALKKGDEVVLSGGLFGRIFAVEEQTVVVEIAEKTRVKVLKSSVSSLAKGLASAGRKPSASTEGTPTAVPASGDDEETVDAEADTKTSSKKKKKKR